MTELSEEQRRIDQRLGMNQFLELYSFISADSLVYLLPHPVDGGLQDLVFTANLALVPSHLSEPTAIVSTFTSEPRKGETAVGQSFFELLGFNTVVCPYRFEGEAEIKHLHHNVYIGGYGERSDIKAYEWMEHEFDMQIVKVEEVDSYLYHLDCSVFPLTHEETIVCTEMFSADEMKAIEKVTNVIDISAEVAYNGACNSVRVNNVILNASNIVDLVAGTEDYKLEIAKNRVLEDICNERGFEVAFFNLSEYMKSGALLSCMCLHLNRHSYQFKLL